MRTQVGIVGAGPAGLLLSHLLHLAGISSIIVEAKSKEYVEGRVRAGVMEHQTAELLDRIGVGARMRREGLVHHGIELKFQDRSHRMDLTDLSGGKSVMVYGQHEVVKDLIAARLETGGTILFDCDDVSLRDFDGDNPSIRFRRNGKDEEVACDFIAGCDGFHGISRPSIPEGVLSYFDREYPFSWLGIMAKAPPPSHELIYSGHDDGFALYSMRSPILSRLYIQCRLDEDINEWPDSRVWDELHHRLGDDRLKEGPVVLKLITAMRSFVVEPMQYRRLFLAGDSAHIVPPTGAKGLNLAAADVMVLSRAFETWFKSGKADLLESYSQTCLRRVWKVQRFSWWMTALLHRFADDNAFDRRRQLAELDYLTSSRAAGITLAENYVGLPMDLV